MSSKVCEVVQNLMKMLDPQPMAMEKHQYPAYSIGM